MLSLPESVRLAVLRSLEVLDSPPEPAFDRLTALAADLFDAPMSVVSLIDHDRQWFKSRVGVDECGTPRSEAFCHHALDLGRGGVLVVEDATRHPIFHNYPVVTGSLGLRFYAGAVLTSKEGAALGTLCVFDIVPRPRPSDRQLNRLVQLAEMVVENLEARKRARQSEREAALLTLVEQMSGVGAWRYVCATGQVAWSDAVYHIHGANPDTFNPNLNSAFDFYHPDDRQMVEGHLDRAIRTGQGFHFQARIIDEHLRERIVHSRSACEFDDLGRVVSVYGVFQDISEHVAATAEAKRGEARFRLLADNMGDVITRIRLDGRSGYISPAVEDLLGYKPTEMVGRTAQFFVHPDDRSLIYDVYTAMAGGADHRTVEARAVRKDGSAVWVETHFKLVRDAEGQPSEMVAVIRDVSARRAMEEALADSEERYRTLAESVSDILMRYGADGRISYVSGACSILGFRPEEIVGRLVTDFIVPEHRGESAAILSQNLTGSTVDRPLHRVLARDGRHVWMEGSPQAVFGPDGAVTEVVTVLRDVTERLTMEAALADSEQRYRTLADNASDILVRFGRDGIVRYISPSCRNIGADPDKAIGQSIFTLVVPGHLEHSQALVDSLFQGIEPDGSTRREHLIVTDDGRQLWVEGSPKLVRDEAGEIVEAVSVLRDITSRKAMEADLVAARAAAEAAAAAKAEFLANMSHEIRTPLTAVVGFSGLLAATPDLPEKARDHVRRIQSGGRALMATVNDILDFSKLEAGQVEIRPEACEPAAVAREALELFEANADAKGLTLSLEGDAPAGLLLDPGRLRQILLNLIGNGVKFTDRGGVTVHLDWTGDRLRVGVTDTGAGISPENQALLFRKFSQVDASSTRRHGGTGLGLAICRGLAEAMGGEIGVDSKPGQGSTFWFELPATVAAAAPQAEAYAQSDLTGLRILVADDNAANRNLARVLLESLGAECQMVADGGAAVAAANQDVFDLILMDLRMPVLSGPEAARAIRAGGGPNDGVPILAFTAQRGDDLDAVFAGAIDKPIQPAALQAAINQALEGPSDREAGNAA